MASVNEKDKQTIVLASGASGGHLFPALAVADELRKQGYRCVFLLGGDKFSSLVTAEGYAFHQLPASPWNVRNPLKKVKAILNLFRALFRAFRLIHKEKASVVFGTGGYATVATVLAAKILGVPTVIQEQNVLPGRANRFLSKRADKVCLSFEASRHYISYREGAVVVTGNPVRQNIVEATQIQRKENGKFRLLILGGSQGAKILSDIIPQAVCSLPDALKGKLFITQQCREEDVERVSEVYKAGGIDFVVKTFFSDVPEILSQCHLLISRSGAGAICEASLLGRASVLIPLKLADAHQVYNAKYMESSGAAVVLDQSCFTVDRLKECLVDLMNDKTRLSQMEMSSKSVSCPEAAGNVAREITRLAERDVMSLVKVYSEQTEKGAR